jgi:addiction module HigA family antidote
MLIILIITKILNMKRAMNPIHPGAIVREDILKEMGISVTQAARALEISRKQLSKIVNETASISVVMAVRLQQAFGVNAEFWLDMQKKYDIWKIEKSGRLHIKPFNKSPEQAITH